MERTDSDFTPPPEVLAYYDGFPEESRLGFGFFRLEFERTKELLARVLPEPPARIVDVGGAAGAYSLWLAEAGESGRLFGAPPRLVGAGRRAQAGRAKPVWSRAS